MMTAKQFLNKYRLMLIKISQLEQEAYELKYRALPSAIRYDSDKVQTSSGHGSIDSLVPAYADLLAQVECRKLQAVNERNKIVCAIQDLQNVTYMQILYKRYIEFKGFVTIAYEMNYSYDRILHAHGEALQAFATQHKDKLG